MRDDVAARLPPRVRVQVVLEPQQRARPPVAVERALERRLVRREHASGAASRSGVSQRAVDVAFGERDVAALQRVGGDLPVAELAGRPARCARAARARRRARTRGARRRASPARRRRRQGARAARPARARRRACASEGAKSEVSRLVMSCGVRGWCGGRGLGEERHALEPEPGRLPVDARDDAEREPAVAPEAAAAGPRARQRLGRAGHVRLEQRCASSVVVEVVDAREPAAGTEVEAERVVPSHGAERRHVEFLARGERLAGRERRGRRRARAGSGGDSPNVLFTSTSTARTRAVAVVADPEAHGVEHVAQHPRERVQDDLAVGAHALAREQRADPRVQRRCRRGDRGRARGS